MCRMDPFFHYPIFPTQLVWSCISFQGCCHKVPKTRWFKTIIYCLRVLEARILQSRHWQGHAPLNPVGETSLPLSVSGGPSSHLWHSLAWRCISQIPHFHMASFCVFISSLWHVSISNFPLLMRTLSYWIRAHPTDPTLIISQHPISK